ncbi:MAG: PHP domain-containing protein [Candidatus Omnitrophica bacterium]|nr:PHP domain-containing protein [Candidatus Omnitrophota bacterium]
MKKFLRILQKQSASIIVLIILSGCTLVHREPAFQAGKKLNPNLFRGVFHLHSEYSHDSKAPLDLIIKTAEKAGLDFVIVTDHNNLNGRASYENTDHPERPLLIFADEVSTWGDGHITGLGIKQEPPNTGDTQAIVNSIHEQGGYVVIAHPLSKRKPWTNWSIQNFDGLEVFCLSDTFYAADLKKLLFKAFFLPPSKFIQSILENPEAGLKLWDEHLSMGRPVAGFGAIDAHLKFYWRGLYAENLLLYFQAVTMYVKAEELKEEKIVESLGRGRSFIAFEVYGLAHDFSFSASLQDKNYGPGDSLSAESPIRFEIKAPEAAEIKLIHNGSVIQQEVSKTAEYETREPGYYRVEVYKDGELWIISNPIYVTG